MSRTKKPAALYDVLRRIGVRHQLAEGIVRYVDFADRHGDGSDGLASQLFLWAAQKELDGYHQGKDEAQMLLYCEPPFNPDGPNPRDAN